MVCCGGFFGGRNVPEASKEDGTMSEVDCHHLILTDWAAVGHLNEAESF